MFEFPILVCLIIIMCVQGYKFRLQTKDKYYEKHRYHFYAETVTKDNSIVKISSVIESTPMDVDKDIDIAVRGVIKKRCGLEFEFDGIIIVNITKLD